MHDAEEPRLQRDVARLLRRRLAGESDGVQQELVRLAHVAGEHASVTAQVRQRSK
jgi:hypothetical protein